MKKIAFSFLLVFAGFQVLAQESPLDRFFDRYEKDTSFTVIHISPRMFQMFSQVAGSVAQQEGQEQVLDVARKLTGLRILTKDPCSDGLQLYRQASALLSRHYQELMSIRDKGSNLRFLVKQDPSGDIHELVMLLDSDKQFLAMSLTGTIDLKELSQIAGSMNIQGFDKLKDLPQSSRH